MRKTAAIILVCLLVIFTFSGCAQKELTIYDSQGAKLATLKEGGECNGEYKEYIDLVYAEAVAAFKEQADCTESQAVKLLFEDNHSIYTAFDRDVYKAIDDAYKAQNKELLFGCAMTDLNGNLIAVYSKGGNDDANYAVSKSAPYSSFKPLAVYAPAMDAGIINWSSVIEDSPYKKIVNESGGLEDWPSNVSGKYSKEDVTVYDAVKTSLNTIAVKTLSEYGVDNSISFLKKNLGLPLEYETQKSIADGEEEVIGNVALGYLEGGVSTIDMAGYYQIFVSGGIYESPHTIIKICDDSEKTVYEPTEKLTQVISSETASIMNLLLQGVLTYGGTGQAADCGEIPAGGKTGTGTADAGNWFVGFTPRYSCALRHSDTAGGNISPEMFGSIIKNLDDGSKQEFMYSPNIEKAAFCKESGMLFTNNCKTIELGYYVKGELPTACDKH